MESLFGRCNFSQARRSNVDEKILIGNFPDPRSSNLSFRRRHSLSNLSPSRDMVPIHRPSEPRKKSMDRFIRGMRAGASRLLRERHLMLDPLRSSVKRASVITDDVVNASLGQLSALKQSAIERARKTRSSVIRASCNFSSSSSQEPVRRASLQFSQSKVPYFDQFDEMVASRASSYSLINSAPPLETPKIPEDVLLPMSMCLYERDPNLFWQLGGGRLSSPEEPVRQALPQFSRSETSILHPLDRIITDRTSSRSPWNSERSSDTPGIRQKALRPDPWSSERQILTYEDCAWPPEELLDNPDALTAHRTLLDVIKEEEPIELFGTPDRPDQFQERHNWIGPKTTPPATLDRCTEAGHSPRTSAFDGANLDNEPNLRERRPQPPIFTAPMRFYDPASVTPHDDCAWRGHVVGVQEPRPGAGNLIGVHTLAGAQSFVDMSSRSMENLSPNTYLEELNLRSSFSSAHSDSCASSPGLSATDSDADPFDLDWGASLRDARSSGFDTFDVAPVRCLRATVSFSDTSSMQQLSRTRRCHGASAPELASLAKFESEGTDSVATRAAGFGLNPAKYLPPAKSLNDLITGMKGGSIFFVGSTDDLSLSSTRTGRHSLKRFDPHRPRPGNV